MIRDRRLWILGVLFFFVALSFWSQSRYPSLDVKSSMSGAVSLQDSLSFEAVFNTSTAQNVFVKVVYTFGNWLYINWQGMSFGLVLALLLMTGLPLLRNTYAQNRFSATLIGSMLGAPLGLCVNCSAPIAYGIYRSGGRTETALATMLSSPVLNVVVIGMSIALLPFYLWGTKLLLSLFLIFVVVPLIVSQEEKTQSGSFAAKARNNLPDESEKRPFFDLNLYGKTTDVTPCYSIIDALRWISLNLFENLWVLIYKMVPLMLLAGLIGAILVTVLPWDLLIELLPLHYLPYILIGMFLLAIFTVVLPVPVAFDVVLVATLVSAGLPDRYAGLLLFGLGSFSIYSFLVLVKAELKRIALVLCVSVVFLTLIAGFTSHYWGQWDAHKQKLLLVELVRDYQHQGSEYPVTELKYQQFEELSAAPSLPVSSNAKLLDSFGDANKVTEIKLNIPQASVEVGNSWRMQLEDLGLQYEPAPVFWTNILPYSAFAGLAAADLNQDYWPDIVSAGYSGIQIYFNTGGRYQLVKVDVLSSYKQVSFVALPDLDNDGDSDLIFGVVSGKKYISYNSQGQFSKVIEIENLKSTLPISLAIADFDQNSELDVVFGNAVMANFFNIAAGASRNTFYYQNNSDFSKAGFPDAAGATLSLLVSDIDGDRQPDLFVGNDYDAPDQYYEYDLSAKHFEPWSFSSLEETTRTTMSIDTADINNDLQLDAYIAQISIEPPDNSSLAVSKRASVYDRSYARSLFGYSNPFGALAQEGLDNCAESVDNIGCSVRKARAQIYRAMNSLDLSECSVLEPEYIWHCAAVAMYESSYRIARFTASAGIECDQIGAGIPDILELCKQMDPSLIEDQELLAQDSLNGAIDQKQGVEPSFPQNSLTNILLIRSEDSEAPRYIDVAKEMGVEYSGWSWNAKFADFDGDQWQDLFVANGWYQMKSDTSNVFFRNQSGNKFSNETEVSGLLDFAPTKSYVSLDIDMDGDLDLVTFNAYGELRSYRNDNTNQHIQFQIQDQIGNRAGVGAMVIIRYTSDKTGSNTAERSKEQIREIKLSGGYLSFNPTVAHFGLGQNNLVTQVEVSMPDGRDYVFEGEFRSGNLYNLLLD